jgi:hypothetical protein
MDELDQLANRASTAYADRPGYRGTTVNSYRPPILEHGFDSNIDAENFVSQLRLQGSKSRFEILNDLTTVLEHR